MPVEAIAAERIRAGDPAALAELCASGGAAVAAYLEAAGVGDGELVADALAGFRRDLVRAGGGHAAALRPRLLAAARAVARGALGEHLTAVREARAEAAFAEAAGSLGADAARAAIAALVAAAPVAGDAASVRASAERRYAEGTDPWGARPPRAPAPASADNPWLPPELLEDGPPPSARATVPPAAAEATGAATPPPAPTGEPPAPLQAPVAPPPAAVPPPAAEHPAPRAGAAHEPAPGPVERGAPPAPPPAGAADGTPPSADGDTAGRPAAGPGRALGPPPPSHNADVPPPPESERREAAAAAAAAARRRRGLPRPQLPRPALRRGARRPGRRRSPFGTGLLLVVAAALLVAGTVAVMLARQEQPREGTFIVRKAGVPFMAAGAVFDIARPRTAKWELEIRSVEPRPGRKWIVLSARTRNLERRNLFPRGLGHRLRTQSGIVIGPDTARIPDELWQAGGRLAIGKRTSVHLGFQVPAEQREFSFEFDPGPGSPRIRVPIN